MKINWKLRLKNKATLTAMLVCVVDFIYSMLAIFEIVPAISENALINGINSTISVLAFLGIVVDPTTNGLSDSNLAMGYMLPRVSKDDEIDVLEEDGEIDTEAFEEGDYEA